MASVEPPISRSNRALEWFFDAQSATNVALTILDVSLSYLRRCFGLDLLGTVRDLCCSPDGRWIALGFSSGLTSVLDVRGGLLRSHRRAHTSEIYQVQLHACDFILYDYPESDWLELITWCDSASPWRQHKGDEVNVAPMPTSLTRSACTIKTACQHRTPRLHWGERKHYTSNNINRKWSRCFQGSSENDVSWSFDETVRPSLLIIIIRIILF